MSDRANQTERTDHPLTVGISPCPNDIYIFSGILLDQIPTDGLRFDFRFEDVETLNQLVREGALDLAKMSYANAPFCQTDYELLDCGGALGRGVGPLLLANGAAFHVEREILVPGQYTTANFLLDYYLDSVGRGQALPSPPPLHKRFLPFDTLYQELCDRADVQGVVIHEKRFTYEADGLTLIHDLGAYWEEQTGYAIPLGCLALRRPLQERERIERIVRRSLQWADAHWEQAFALCREYAQDLTDGVIEAHINLYVNAFSHDLGEEGRAAVAFFLQQQERARAK